MDNSLGTDAAATDSTIDSPAGDDRTAAGPTIDSPAVAGPTGDDPTAAVPTAAGPTAAADPSATGHGTPGPRPRLLRSRQDRMIGGVCGGAAQALGIDSTLLRVALVAATVLGFGAGAVIYLACWMIIPEE